MVKYPVGLIACVMGRFDANPHGLFLCFTEQPHVLLIAINTHQPTISAPQLPASLPRAASQLLRSNDLKYSRPFHFRTLKAYFEESESENRQFIDCLKCESGREIEYTLGVINASQQHTTIRRRNGDLVLLNAIEL